ncbi:hypothetical protein KH5_22000 [Urechidicola sp. KH5]
MKKIVLLLSLIIFSSIVFAQDTTTVTAKNSDISDNLDLQAVAAVFGESKDLEDFEKKLNDPETQLSNLDLNEDGEVDYIRVVDNSKGNTKTVTLQVVIGKDQYQDVAVIDVVKDKSGDTQIQVVGDVYMYGPNYIIEPVYVAPPVIFTWFWVSYRFWVSPYYWGFYPPYYRPWRPYPPHIYRSNVSVNININRNNYNYVDRRRSNDAVRIQDSNRRNDYAKANRDKSFENRNKGVSNRADLDRKRPSTGNRPSTRPSAGNNTSNKPSTRPSTSDKSRPSTRPNARPSTGKKVNPNWQPSTRQRSHTTPSTRPATRPSTSPSNRPSTRPKTNPSKNSSHTRPQPSQSRNYNRPTHTRRSTTPRVGGRRGF